MKVTYLDHMGSDLTVVNAARVSFSKKSDWEYTCSSCGTVKIYDGWECGEPCHLKKTLTDKDTKLINYLAEHHHWLPFRHPHISFHCKAPIFIARQAVKHQVGMSWSEVSRRYVDDEPELWWPTEWRKRAEDKKQGSSDETVPEPWLLRSDVGELVLSYNELIDDGVAPELARIVLPMNMYTEWVWTGSLLSWAHFVKQRTESHAQKEIQEFASMFIPTLEEHYPVSWKALMREYEF